MCLVIVFCQLVVPMESRCLVVGASARFDVPSPRVICELRHSAVVQGSADSRCPRLPDHCWCFFLLYGVSLLFPAVASISFCSRAFLGLFLHCCDFLASLICSSFCSALRCRSNRRICRSTFARCITRCASLECLTLSTQGERVFD